MSDRKICGLARAMAIGSIAAKFAAEEINLDNFRGAIAEFFISRSWLSRRSLRNARPVPEQEHESFR